MFTKNWIVENKRKEKTSPHAPVCVSSGRSEECGVKIDGKHKQPLIVKPSAINTSEIENIQHFLTHLTVYILFTWFPHRILRAVDQIKPSLAVLVSKAQSNSPQQRHTT